MEKKISDVERLIGGPVPFQKIDGDGRPVYLQLAKAIEKQIEKKILKAGSLLPSERVVASVNKISISTVRKAFEELIGRQFIYRLQGKGTFVSESADRRKKVRFYSFTKGFHDVNETAGLKFVELTKSEGIPEINKELKIKEEEDLYILKRFITQNNAPVIYSISYLPYKLFKSLDAYSTEKFENYALYIFLEKEFEVSTLHHVELFKAVTADGEIGKRLGVEPGHPLLRIEQLVYTHKDIPYEYRISYCLTDDSKIRRAF